MSEVALGGSWAGGWDEPGVLSVVIVESGAPGTGVFVYSGTPALGNPPVAYITRSSADPYGNALPAQDIVSFQAASGNFAQLSAAELQIGNSTFSGNGTFGQSAAIPGALAAVSPTIGADTACQLALVPKSQAAPLAAQAAVVDQLAAWTPGQAGIQIESWHAMTLVNSWANAAGNVTAQYRLTPENEVQVVGAISGAAAAAAAFFTLPAGYRPASQQQSACGATTGVIAGHAPYIQVTAAGVLSVQSVTVPTAGMTIVFNCRFPLDA